MKETPTPRTDKATREARDIEDLFPLTDECRKLERELAVANERIMRMKKIGDELAFSLHDSPFTEDVVAIEEWRDVNGYIYE